MNKQLKLFFLCSILFLAATTLFSQDAPLQQYQNFSWKPIANARRYEVAVEKKQDDGSWTAEKNESTKKSRLEMLLYPGNYRVSIITYNVLNRKASQSPWIQFIILDETEPFLFEDTFTSGGNGKIGTLNTKNGSVPSTIAEESKDSPVQAEPEPVEISQGNMLSVLDTNEYPPNIIRIKGKNIFFEETTFSLVPIAASESTPGAIPSLVQNRDSVPLTVLSRDRNDNTVIVAYDESKLATGYYKLQVQNPGNKSTALAVNIYTSRVPSFMRDDFGYDEKFKVRTLTLTRSQTTPFVLKAKDCEYDTVFSLVPASGIPYPFESPLKRNIVTFAYDASTLQCTSDGTMLFPLTFAPEEIETGYYLLTASTPNKKSDTELLLVTASPASNSALPEVLDVKTKYNKKKENVEITVIGKELASDTAAVLVAPYNSETGTNERIELTLTDFSTNKKKIVLNAESTKISAGTYGLLLESNGSTALTYVTIDDKYSFKLAKLTQEESDDIFLRSKTSIVPKNISVGTAINTVNEYPLGETNSYSFTEDSVTKLGDVAGVGTKCNIERQKDENGKGHLVINVKRLTSTTRSVIREDNENIIKLFAQGDSLRFKISSDSNYKGWKVRLITNKNEGISYATTISGHVKEVTDDTGTYYLFSAPLTSFKNTSWDSYKEFDQREIFALEFAEITAAAENKIDVYDIETFESSSVPTMLVKKCPFIMTNGAMAINYETMKKETSASIIITPIDFNFISQEIGTNILLDSKAMSFDTSIKLALPYDAVKPYVGAGFGIGMKKDFSEINDYYLPCYAGLRLFNVIDLRYTFKIHGLNTSFDKSTMYAEDVYSLVITIWHRNQKLVRVPKEKKQ